MTIRESLNKARQYERAFNLTRWGSGFPELAATNGWPATPEDTQSGRYGENFVADYKIERCRKFEFDNDDGTVTTKLSWVLRVADTDHQAFNDAADFSVYVPTIAELEDASLPFPKTKSRDTLIKLLELMYKFDIVSDDPLAQDWEPAVETLLANFEGLDGRHIKAGVNGAMYVNKEGELKGPYMEIRWMNHEPDGDYAGPDDMPF